MKDAKSRLTIEKLRMGAYTDGSLANVCWSPDTEDLIADKIGPHVHSFYEVVFIESGYGRHTINGDRIEVSPGQLYVLAPGTSHDPTQLQSASIWVFIFNLQVLDAQGWGGSVFASGRTADGKMVGIVAEPDAIALANDGKEARKSLSAGKRYSTSKLCTILYAYELHRRLRRARSSIASIAFDPGAVPETGLLRTMPKPVQWLAKTRFMKWITKRVGVTQGSISFSGASLANVAADPAYRNASGKYFQSNNGALSDTRSSKLSYDEQRALKLWNDSKTLVRLQPNGESVQLR
jgi:mannose-6-phosphate isomerase-like protein (cupin superfamily)